MASLHGSRDLSKMPHKIENYRSNIRDNLFIRVPTLFCVGLLYVEYMPIKTENADFLINDNNDMDNTSTCMLFTPHIPVFFGLAGLILEILS